MHPLLTYSSSILARYSILTFGIRGAHTLFGIALLLAFTTQAVGASFYWDANGETSGTGGTGNWNTSATLWRAGSATGTLGAWPTAGVDNDAVFAGTVGTVDIVGGVSVNDLTFSTSNYLLQGSPLTLTGGTTSVITANNTTTIAANLLGSAGFTKEGGADLTLRGNNSSLSGTVTINAGRVFLFTNDSGSANVAWVLNRANADNLAFNTFPSNGGDHTIQLGSLSGVAGAILRNAGGVAGTATFVIGALGTDTSFHGNINNGTGADLAAITKTGSGVLRLTGANGYTGLTTVDSGTLWLDGATHSGSGAYVVNANGTLKGAVNLSGHAVTLNGTISPGNNIGTMTTGNETWNGGGSYQFEINDVDAGAGTGWDLLSISGALDISALDSSANKFKINLTSLALDNTAGQVHDFDKFADYAWLLADATNPIADFDPSKFDIITSAFLNDFSEINPGSFQLVLGSAVGGDDSQLYLQYSAASVPEPATLHLAIMLAAGLTCWQIRRHVVRWIGHLTSR